MQSIIWGCDTDKLYVTISGMTGLAHLSTVSIGKTHGVYVLKRPSKSCQLLWECAKFLHKPNIDVMENTERCIVFKDESESWVLTDSSFFISPGVTRVLLEYYQSNAPISCEIDAYGDFLQVCHSNPITSENVLARIRVCNSEL